MIAPTTCHAVIVIVTAIAIRVVATLSLPLIITNDGAFYLYWAGEIASGSWPDMPAYRTPMYPLWLAAVLSIAGDSAHTVLIAQHMLGIATAAACWWLGRVAFGARVGLVSGLLVAIDPWLLAIASFALSDILCIALPLVALSADAGKPGWARSTVAGVLVGAAVLTRPTAIAWLPGVLTLALIAPAPRFRLRWLRAAAVSLAMMATLVPWIALNASRGVVGVAETQGLALWGGLARSGQLDQDFTLPESLAPLADPLFQPTPSERDVMRFYNRVGTTEAVNRTELLSAWARSSVRTNPGGYAQAFGHGLAWQANATLPGSPYTYDSLRWMMRRLGGTDEPADGPANLSTAHMPDFVTRFEDARPRGPFASIYRDWPLGMQQRFPQPPLGLATAVLICVTAYQRRWVPAAILASSMPIVLGHAIILQPFSRYSISAWMIWWIGAVAGVTLLAASAGRWTQSCRWLRFMPCQPQP